jgi:hypothetical protein
MAVVEKRNGVVSKFEIFPERGCAQSVSRSAFELLTAPVSPAIQKRFMLGLAAKSISRRWTRTTTTV